jgi:DNA-binding LacI/PurR family transcriptional regulator
MRIPEDVSVAGFDDLDIARVLDLTTVRVDGERLGATAVDALVALLAGGTAAAETGPARGARGQGLDGPAPG